MLESDASEPDQPQNDNQSKEGEEGNQKKDNGHTGILETTFTVLSILLIISVCTFLIINSFGTPPPASFSLSVAYPAKRGEFTAVEVFVENSGEESAKAVHVTGEVTGADGKPVEAEATLDWLPGQSKREITLIFPGDATTSSPEVRVRGYEEP